MPYDRPGLRYYATATKQVNHGAPVTEDNVVGVASKQKQPDPATTLLANYPVIAVSETFVIVDKGVVVVPFVTSSVKGSTVWINKTNNALTLTDPGGGNGLKFGRVVEIGGQRGAAAGTMRVDLDAKDSF